MIVIAIFTFTPFFLVDNKFQQTNTAFIFIIRRRFIMPILYMKMDK